VVSLVLATDNESHPVKEHQYHLDPTSHFEHHVQPVLANLPKEPNPSQSNHHYSVALPFCLLNMMYSLIFHKYNI
jgi:hypothetical protein